jgi:protein-disulfide isomerase
MRIAALRYLLPRGVIPSLLEGGPVSLVAELQRRRVFRALVGYGIAAFAVLQIVEPVMHGLHWPDAVLSFVVVALAAGFPVVIALAWIFDVNAGVVERTPRPSNLSRPRIAFALGAIAILASAPGLLWYFVLRKPPRPAVADSPGAVSPSGRRRVPVAGSPSRGPADAPVTIVEFGDFQCPYTKLAQPMLHQLFEKYPDKIRLVWKDAPAGVHLEADDAAAFAREALREKGPDAFWRVHDKLFAAAPGLGPPVLGRIAAEEGLDAGAIRAAVREGRYRAAIDADVDLAHAIDYVGTPTFFVNGRRFDEDPDLLEKGVSEELAEARRRMAAGVPPGALYEDFQRNADSTPTPVERMALPDPGRRPARGGAAPRAVLVHEFCDLSLLKCAWIEPPLRKTLASYGEEVRLVWWDVSDPQQALSARVMTAAISAGNDGFWKMHDAILARQWRERFEQPPPETLSPAVLRGLAKESGLNMELYDYAVAIGATEDEKQQLVQARSLARAGLIVIDGEVYGGFAPPHLWRAAIDRALARRH